MDVDFSICTRYMILINLFNVDLYTHLGYILIMLKLSRRHKVIFILFLN